MEFRYGVGMEMAPAPETFGFFGMELEVWSWYGVGMELVWSWYGVGIEMVW